MLTGQVLLRIKSCSWHVASFRWLELLTMFPTGNKTCPAGNHVFKVNNRKTRKCEICSKLTLETTARRHWRRSDVIIVNFKHISHLVVTFLLLTQVNIDWVKLCVSQLFRKKTIHQLILHIPLSSYLIFLHPYRLR